MIWRYLVFLAALGATVASAALVGGAREPGKPDLIIVRIPSP